MCSGFRHPHGTVGLMQRLTFTIGFCMLLSLPLGAAEPFYGASIVHAPWLWPVTTGRSVKVAIIDTGIDASNPALSPSYRGGYDFVHNDSIAEEEASEGHGTFVAGVVLQVAPDAELYALKILGSENFFET